MNNLSDYLRGPKAQWYTNEKNTAELLKAVVASRPVRPLSGDDIWNLIRLTWVTPGKSGDHWKILKVPALAMIWKRPNDIQSDLETTIGAMSLPPTVAAAAIEQTGIVDFRNTWRNSSRDWCEVNRADLVRVIRDATRLEPNDQCRLVLAEMIDKLPSVPTPSGRGGNAAPARIITPLVACLDPHRRFPIINGREDVKLLLKAWNLANRSFTEQVRGILGIIDQFGISDAFMVDVLAERIVGMAGKLAKVLPEEEAQQGHGSSLPYLDEDERESVQKSKTVLYRNRHNKMTNALRQLCKPRELKQGTLRDCRYDVLIENYDGAGRDLLLELKPDSDKGAIRIAIGQLLDYRRFLPHQAGTDLALLTILPPQKTHCELLLGLQISPIWFKDETCQSMLGKGIVWQALRTELAL